MSTWRFGDLELVVLWEQFTGEGLPDPFIFTSRTPLLFDYLREKRAVAEQLRARQDPSLRWLAEVVTQPDLRITVSGFDCRDPENAEGRIRMIALRRADRGLLIKQLPGETYLHSGGFVVSECDPLRLADEVAAALPEVEAGKQAEIELVDPRRNAVSESEIGRTIIDDVFEDSAGLRSKRFLMTTPVRMGTIQIGQGHSKFGPQGITRYGLEWRDLDGDGRYLIGGEPPYRAVAVDGAKFTRAINVRVAAVIRAIKDERGMLGVSE
ncbi:ESX secretion-associated protein EspG [Nocardia sp. NPDC127526]|uniref:ESX secretion-associated protein EspG n=1 Tax=Nocardia sp. NPDC127526 TaxID=3345393 RepID=UPI00362C27B9